MNNAMDFNSKEFKDLTNAVMMDLSSNNAKLETIDDMYNAVCKYVKMTKEQFMEFYKQAKEKAEAEDAAETKELNAEELDMVVGGMPGWLKTTLFVAGCITAAALVCSGIGAAGGAGLAAIVTADDISLGLAAASALSGAASLGAAYGAVTIGGGFGVLVGIAAATNDKVKSLFNI